MISIPTRWTPELLASLLEAFDEIEQVEKDLQKRKAELLGRVIGESVFICQQCYRPMLPSRLWVKIPLTRRPKSCAKFGNIKFCHMHLTRYREKNGLTKRKKLTTEELAKLRKDVGFS